MTHEVRKDLRYTKTHEWVKHSGKTVRVGITDHAQSQLTDIVFVELPSVGKQVKKGEELCIVESVKSVSEIYAPVSGTVVKVNKDIEDSPETINKSPYDDGWLVELQISTDADIAQLLDAESYTKLT